VARSIPWNLLGFGVSGDVGGYTIYTDRKFRKVAFPIAPPEKPPSPAQINLRARFKTAQANWKAETDQVKQELEEACRRASIVMTGQNLYIKVALKNDNDALQTLAKQTGTTLPIIDFVP